MYKDAIRNRIELIYEDPTLFYFTGIRATESERGVRPIATGLQGGPRNTTKKTFYNTRRVLHLILYLIIVILITFSTN